MLLSAGLVSIPAVMLAEDAPAPSNRFDRALVNNSQRLR